MSTIFIAVQCFQCSTMQVKQQKKSSNKWNCVICNQKQSVRKIFDRGYQAKDIRKFVQGFNMSRQFQDTQPIIPPDCRKILEDDQIQVTHCHTPSHHHRPKRSHWAEYLDSPDNKLEETAEEGNCVEDETEIVTELPKEIFEKTSFSSPSSRPKKKSFTPPFKKRKAANSIPQVESRQCKMKLAEHASRWAAYLDEEVDEKLVCERYSPNPCYSSNQDGLLQNQFNDQRVEEDIHPDFI